MGAWGRRGGALGVAVLGDKLIGLSIDLEELHSASRAFEARVDEALAGNQELQSSVQRLDSGLVDDELNSLTEDDLPSEIPRAERRAARARGVLASASAGPRSEQLERRSERCGLTCISAPRSASERPGGHWL